MTLPSSELKAFSVPRRLITINRDLRNLPFSELKPFSVPRHLIATNYRFKQESSTRLNRVFVVCFNVTPAFAESFKFWKSKGVSEFAIKYMEAAFDKEAGSGEFFLEFTDKVWEHKLIECFKLHGACQVNTITFTHNDGEESASNALLRVLTMQGKTNLKYTRGTCPPSLLAKVQTKQAAAREVSSTKEFDEKTLAAIKQSVALQEETKQAVVKVEGSLQSHEVKLDGIQQGVCNVIPDYQREIESLKAIVAHKTALCDKVEGQKAYKTRLINQQDLLISRLEEEQCKHVKEKQAWAHREAALLQQADIATAITMARQMVEDMKNEREVMAIHIELLTSIITEERARKRART